MNQRFIGTAFSLACFAIVSSALGATVAIKWNTTKQEIDGFGASGSFMQPDSVRACNVATVHAIGVP